MPLVDWNQETTYNHTDVYGGIGGYNRNNKEGLSIICNHRFLREAFPFQPGESILLVGAGFGWIAEDFISNGLGPVCAIDTSTWIQSNKNDNSFIEVYNYDVTNDQHKNSIKQILNLSVEEKIDWCITEDFFTGLSDVECLNIANHLRILGNNVIHYITSPPKKTTETLMTRNWKTQEEWKELLSPDYILMVNSNKVL